MGIDIGERYERGLALKKAGLYNAAIGQFEEAAVDPTVALKAYAQIGVCYKSVGRNQDAVAAFQKALRASAGSVKETIQILYVLGRTLESLGRMDETLEAYRWIRREDPGYRDVATRIERLSSRQSGSIASGKKSSSPSGYDLIGGWLNSWQDLLRTPK